MLWFVVLQGLAIAALGVWAIVTRVVPLVSGIGVLVFGLLWAGIIVFVIQFQRKSGGLRDALATTNPEADQQNRKQRRLLWLQWGLFFAAMIWIVVTARMTGPNELWSLYGAGVLLLAMFCVMLYRMFINTNLGAEAIQTLSASLGAPRKRFLGKHGAGFLSIFFVIVILAGVFVDEYADLPIKFMSLLWYGVGLMLVWALAAVLWRWLRKTFG